MGSSQLIPLQAVERQIRLKTRAKGRQPDPQSIAEVAAALGEAPRRRDLLIEHLHCIQDTYGQLAERHLVALAREMKIGMAEVFEVATFYHHFDVVRDAEAEVPVKLTVRVCESLSCELAGARDLLTRRVTMLHKQIYVYPLQLDAMQKRSFLRALIEQTVDVSTHARFYNTITSNCTNELAKVAGLGWHYSWVLTGYSPQRLYELKLIPGATFEAAQQRALLTEPLASWNAMETPEFDHALLTELRSRSS